MWENPQEGRVIEKMFLLVLVYKTQSIHKTGALVSGNTENKNKRTRKQSIRKTKQKRIVGRERVWERGKRNGGAGGGGGFVLSV